MKRLLPEIIFNDVSLLSSRSYCINYSSAFIIVDENTGEHCLPVLRKTWPRSKDFHVIEIKSGEDNKTLSNCEYIWEKLLKKQADRNSLVCNLGGGVITDMGAFAASVFKRGVRFINIPTSLLAMVDAAIGGKTGVNFMQLKNQIGLFTQPEFTYIQPDFLTSLPEDEMLSGFGEILKCSLIEGGGFWEIIKQEININDFHLTDLIKKCIEIKTAIVEEDLYEKHKRKILNFGHTVGHALETLFLEKGTELSHGHAVALGLVAESLLSVKYAGLSQKTFNEVKKVVGEFFDIQILKDTCESGLTGIMANDKKNSQTGINIILMEKPGKMKLDHYFSFPELDDFWKNEMPLNL